MARQRRSITARQTQIRGGPSDLDAPVLLAFAAVGALVASSARKHNRLALLRRRHYLGAGLARPRSNIMSKLQVPDRVQAIVRARPAGFGETKPEVSQ